MKNYENSHVKCILSELERIITHAEKSIPNIEEGNNQRLEEIKFEQLTRESESKLNSLKFEVEALTDIEIMVKAAKDMCNIRQKFTKIDTEVLLNINIKLMHASEHLEKLINQRQSIKNDIDYYKSITPKEQPKHPFLDFLISICEIGADRSSRKSVNNAKKRLNDIGIYKERFEQITEEFRIVLRKLCEIHDNLLVRIDKTKGVSIANLIAEEKKSSNRGRKPESWWGGKWENLTEQEVEQRLKQAYEATYSLLSDLEGEKNIDINNCRNAVWAAVYFYAAEAEGLVNPNKSANSICFIGEKDNPRGLYNIGVNCNKGTVHNYYKIIKTFLNATIDNDCNLPYINQLIIKISEEKNTDEYPLTREWLGSNKNFINVTNELGNKVNPSENVIMFVAKNLPIIRKTFYKVQPYFK